MGQGGCEAHRPDGVAEKRALPFGEDRNQGWKIHGEEPQVSTHRQVEKLVAVKIVGRDERDYDMQNHHRYARERERTPGG